MSTEDSINDDGPLCSQDDLEGLLLDAHDDEDNADEQISGLTTKGNDNSNIANQCVINTCQKALMSQQNTAEIPADAFNIHGKLSYRRDNSLEMQIIKEQDSDAEEGECLTSSQWTEDFINFTEHMNFDDSIDAVEQKPTHLAEFEQAGRREQ